MIALVLLGLLVSVNTTPWYGPYDYNDDFQDKMDSFWDNFDRKMDNLGAKIENVVKRAKSRASNSKIEGDNYVITNYLTGFNKEDIVVKAKNGNLVIQAVHNVPGDPVNNYQEVSGLPDYVNDIGRWSYNNGILKIVFPIIQRGNGDTTDSTVSYVNNANDKPIKNNADEDVIRTKSDLDDDE